MGTLWQDLRHGIRMLFRNPGFTIVVVLVISLGVGATTAVFSVVNGVLLRSLPYEDPDRLVMLFSTRKDWGRLPTSTMNFLDWKRQSRSFENMAISEFKESTYRHEEGTDHIKGMCVSPNLFALLGLKAFAGRSFMLEETWPNHHYVILGHGFWQRRFGGNESVLGKAITLGATGESYTVVGVMPPNRGCRPFLALAEGKALVDFWIPLERGPEGGYRGRGNLRWDVVARLKPGVSVQQAQTEMDAIASQLTGEYSDPARVPGVEVIPLHTHIVGQMRPLVLLAAGAAGFVLLISCANVANLLLVRGLARRREMALRATLGAGRLRLLRQGITESLLLCSLGGILGLLLAGWGISVFRAIAPNNIPRLQEAGIDSATLVFALGAVLLTGGVVGLIPVLQTCRVGLNETLKEDGRSATMRFGRRRLASQLVVAELSLSLVLLIGSGLLINSFSRLLLLNPGYTTKNILTMKVSNMQGESCYEVLRRIESLPGVNSAALVYGLPLCKDIGGSDITPEDRPRSDTRKDMVNARIVTPGYLELMKIPLVAGRHFTENDRQDSAAVTIVSESLARRFWANEDPIGKRFQFGFTGATVQIVGIVRDTKNVALNAEAELETYIPGQQYPGQYQRRGFRIVVATGSDCKGLIEPLKRQIWSVDKNAVISEIQTMGEIVAETLADSRFLTAVVSVFSLTALILAIFGIYGLIAHSVRQRTQEIGVRMALGASYSDVLKGVLGQGLKLSLIGIAIGLGGAIVLTRVISNLLYDVSPTDPLTFVCVSLLLAGVALLATYIPARRAARIDPMVALRYE